MRSDLVTIFHINLITEERMFQLFNALNYAIYKIFEHRELKGESKMDNPEKLATLATHDTRRRQTKTKTHHNTENYKDEQHRSTKEQG